MMLLANAAPVMGGSAVREPTNLLHWDDREFILFAFWKSGTIFGMIGSVMIIILIGILHEAIISFRAYLATDSQPSSDTMSNERLCPASGNSNSSEDTSFKHSVIKVLTSVTRQRVIHTLLYGAELIIYVIVILLICSFNIWIIIAVLLGKMLGYFIFTTGTATLAAETPRDRQSTNFSVQYANTLGSRNQH